MSYQLQVYGRTWEGFRSVYTYSVPAPITTDAEANRAAGDFSGVIDWRLVKHESTQARPDRHTTVSTHIERVIRGFRNGMTPARFTRLQGC